MSGSAALVRPLGGPGGRITEPDEIVPAIERGIAATGAGRPAPFDFTANTETSVSRYPRGSS